MEAFLQVNTLVPWSSRLHVVDYFCCRLVCKDWRRYLTQEEEIRLVKNLLVGFRIRLIKQFYAGLVQLADRSNETESFTSQPIVRSGNKGLFKGICPHLCWESEFGVIWTYNWEISKGYQRIGGIEEPLDEFQLGIVAIECQVTAGARLFCRISIGGRDIFVIKEEPTTLDRTLRFNLFEMPLIITQHRLGFHSIQVASTVPFVLHLVRERINPKLQSRDQVVYITRSPYAVNKCCLLTNIGGMLGGGWYTKPEGDQD